MSKWDGSVISWSISEVEERGARSCCILKVIMYFV